MKILFSLNLGGEKQWWKPISYISYGENEKKIIKAGIVEIRKVLMGNDKNKKRSLLFALDWFYGPLLKQDISDIHNELVELLQTVVISSTDDDVSEDALQLYAIMNGTFEYLKKYKQGIAAIKPDVLYAVNMDKEI